jgi:pimeloyl-ACP methyl ester carboxylesterase
MISHHLKTSSAVSADGTTISYLSVGNGPGLVLVGGVLSSASTYLPIADAVAERFTVHVMNRRGRPPSGPQRPGHSIETESADLVAVAMATQTRAAFGHSFGGLVVLETARHHPVFDELYLYEPGVSVAGSLDPAWLDGYEHLLRRGDRRGAFARMVKDAGFAPRALAVMPLWYVKTVLRLAIRGTRWKSMEALLEANLTEHQIVAALDHSDASRFSTVTARTHLIGGAKSPDVLSRRLLRELAEVIPQADVQILPGLGHLAPENHPSPVANAMLERARAAPAVVKPEPSRSTQTPGPQSSALGRRAP